MSKVGFCVSRVQLKLVELDKKKTFSSSTQDLCSPSLSLSLSLSLSDTRRATNKTNKKKHTHTHTHTHTNRGAPFCAGMRKTEKFSTRSWTASRLLLRVVSLLISPL